MSFEARKVASSVPTRSWRGTGPFEAEMESGHHTGASVVFLPAHGGGGRLVTIRNEGILQKLTRKIKIF